MVFEAQNMFLKKLLNNPWSLMSNKYNYLMHFWIRTMWAKYLWDKGEKQDRFNKKKIGVLINHLTEDDIHVQELFQGWPHGSVG